MGRCARASAQPVPPRLCSSRSPRRPRWPAARPARADDVPPRPGARAARRVRQLPPHRRLGALLPPRVRGGARPGGADGRRRALRLHAALAAGAGPRRLRRRAPPLRGRDRAVRPLGRRRPARGRPHGRTAAARVRRRLDAGRARPGRGAPRAGGGPGGRRRPLPQLRHPRAVARPRPLDPRGRAPQRQPARRAPCADPDRPHRPAGAARRGGARPRLRRHGPRRRGEPGRDPARLDAGQGAVGGRPGAGLAPRARHRPRRAAPPDADGQAGDGRRRARPARGGRPAGEAAVRAAARHAAHRHPCRLDGPRGRGRLHAAGRRARARDLPARALPGEDDARRCLSAGRQRQRRWRRGQRGTDPADPHRRLGLQLAGRVPLPRAGRAARGDTHRDALHVRQLGGQPAEPARAAAPRALRRGDRRRDGRGLDPGRARRSRRSPRARARGSRAHGGGGDRLPPLAPRARARRGVELGRARLEPDGGGEVRRGARAARARGRAGAGRALDPQQPGLCSAQGRSRGGGGGAPARRGGPRTGERGDPVQPGPGPGTERRSRGRGRGLSRGAAAAAGRGGGGGRLRALGAGR